MTAVLALAVALAHGAVFFACLRVGPLLGLTRFSRLVTAYAAALVIPTTLTIWVLWMPVGIDGALTISSSLILGATLFLLIAGRMPAAPPRLRPGRRHLPALAPALAIAVLVGLALFAALGKPVEEIDGLLYHGPAAANVIQHDSLFGWDAPAPYVYYPSFIAVQGATVVHLSGSTALLDAVQVPYMLLLALVIWAWAGRGRATPLAGVLAAAVISTPAVTGNARALYVDVAYAAVLLAGAWLIALSIRRCRPALLGAGATLVGVAAAIKPAGLALCVALGVAVLAVVLVRRTRGAVVAGVAAIVGPVVGGAAFYLRNLVEFGNPLYPVGTTVAGVRLEGLIDLGVFQEPPRPPLADRPDPLALAENIWLGATNSYDAISYDARIGAFGPAVWILAALAVIAIVGLVVRRLGLRPQHLLLVGPPVFFAILIVLAQPQAWYPRYVITVIALGAVVIGLALDRLRMPRRTQAVVALALLVPVVPLAWSTEHRLVQGIPAVRAEPDPDYNRGVGGWNVAYQDEYAWVRDQPCGTRVLVASTDHQNGLLNTYGIGLWGDGLCFDVEMVRDRRGMGEDGLEGDRRRLIRMVPRADFVVAFEVDRPLVEEAAALAGLRAEVASDTIPFYGADQVVYRIVDP